MPVFRTGTVSQLPLQPHCMETLASRETLSRSNESSEHKELCEKIQTQDNHDVADRRVSVVPIHLTLQHLSIGIFVQRF